MDEFYELVGGYIEIDKSLFLTDILSKNSSFRYLVKRENSFKQQPEVQKKEFSIKIIFDNAKELDLEHSYKDFFKNLKNKYKHKLKGRLIVRVSCNATFLSNIDFNKYESDIYIY